MTIFIRLASMGVLLWFIYGETGPVTTLVFFLMAIKDELMVHWMRTVQGCINLLKDRIKEG